MNTSYRKRLLLPAAALFAVGAAQTAAAGESGSFELIATQVHDYTTLKHAGRDHHRGSPERDGQCRRDQRRPVCRRRELPRGLRGLRQDFGCRHRSGGAVHHNGRGGRRAVPAVREAGGKHCRRRRRHGQFPNPGRHRKIRRHRRRLPVQDELPSRQVDRDQVKMHLAEAVTGGGDVRPGPFPDSTAPAGAGGGLPARRSR